MEVLLCVFSLLFKLTSPKDYSQSDGTSAPCVPLRIDSQAMYLLLRAVQLRRQSKLPNYLMAR